MTETTRLRIPQHLRKYVVEQNYDRYTPRDQAVWRYIMRQLKSFLSEHAHPVYVEGLKKTGLTVDSIPRIDAIDEHLVDFGWGAVPVSGFIPPAAFMEFQAIGVLPIACDMRSLDHLLYTPAPDIVHEAAGHAPILVDPEYAAYLRQYGEVARRSIISREDLAQYEAIRVLSDIKEDPSSQAIEIERAEKQLDAVNRSMQHVSEAALLSRMNWWTAEYGLIKTGKDVRIFGAGLLSSVGEARDCLNSSVKKIPLTVDCVNFSYDITEPQPQLFVADGFAQLGDVLEQLANRLAYRRGGAYGLDRAIEAATVNTVRFNSGIQIGGVLKDYVRDPAGNPIYLHFSGPCQLACSDVEIEGQGTNQHAQGFSTPLGRLQGDSRCLSMSTPDDLAKKGIKRGEKASLQFTSGVHVTGRVSDWSFQEGRLILLSWKDCRVTLGDRLLFDPAWGDFDMAVGEAVTSVSGGPADRSRFGTTEDFVAKHIPAKAFTSELEADFDRYERLRQLRTKPDKAAGEQLLNDYLLDSKQDWLMGVELLELGIAQNFSPGGIQKLKTFLSPENFSSATEKLCVRAGVALAARVL